MLTLALLMLVEKTTEVNPFGDLGGVNPVPTVRAGHVRAPAYVAHRSTMHHVPNREFPTDAFGPPG